jgi:hypothetical protein
MPAGVRHNPSLGLDPLDTRVNRLAGAPVPHDDAGLEAPARAFGIEPARLGRC